MKITTKPKSQYIRCKPFSARYQMAGVTPELIDTFEFYGTEPESLIVKDITEERYRYYRRAIK